ncbi:RsfA family transcriptional regulator [Paenibacillus turpanensis]|uniref:RsfA family transcriptional regulator n=1 Tax=Paenibacillus turpanensis TaxID=2689078 RepID=UPI00140CCE3C|nr:RsfA family transcriptional regulator [Paenibacillus turpanensis]
MSAVRQDAWTAEDDLILAEVTLRHIREGSTQLAAFEEVGERIGRTAAACGFRWNSAVRKKYEASIQIAKSQRQKRNQLKKTVVVSGLAIAEADEAAEDQMSEDSISVDAVIRFLRQWKSTNQELYRQVRQLEKELRDKDEELAELQAENEKLRREVNNAESDYRHINEDYKALLQIMDRARKMAFLVEEDEELKAKFKMDANGNLERIE